MSSGFSACSRAQVTGDQPGSLQLCGEHELPVPPLRLAAPDDERENVLRSEAAALFVERAQAIRPTLDLSEDTVRAIAQLCARLDGLPLAIELAARRVNILSPRAILARLSTGLTCSTHPAPTCRHDSRRCGHDPMELRPPGIQRKSLLPRLAVFSGGADLDAIEGVVER